MALQTRYLFTAAMDVEAAQEKLFNEVYDTEHVPLLLKVPGVIAVARLKKTTLTMIIGGEKKTIVMENEPTYSATYEIESPEVLTTPRVGRRGGPGALAGPGAPLHQEPPPRPLPAHPAVARGRPVSARARAARGQRARAHAPAAGTWTRADVSPDRARDGGAARLAPRP